MQSNPEWLTTLDAIMEIVPSYPPLTGPPAPATLPGLAPAFSFQKEELLLLPVPEVVELVISGILWLNQEPALKPFRRSGCVTSLDNDADSEAQGSFQAILVIFVVTVLCVLLFTGPCSFEFNIYSI